MRNFKTLSLISIIIAIFAITALCYVIISRNPQNQIVRENAEQGNMQNPDSTHNSAPENNNSPSSTITDSDLKGINTYNSPDGYSLDFSAETFTHYQTVHSFPSPGDDNEYDNHDIDAFKHEINIEHCALSGQCTPTTINMSWGSIARNETFDPKNYPNLDLKKVNYGKVTGYEGSMGVEGEGIVYTFIPQPNVSDKSSDMVIIIFRTYIDENIVGVYKNSKEFIPLLKQKEIYKSIINSLKIKPNF